MIQFPVEPVKIGDIPAFVVYPVKKDPAKAVIFYHGWSSTAALQKTRALILAAYGYTVLCADAVHHGTRGALPDYYTVPAYDLFWDTIFQNMKEFPALASWLRAKGYRTPWVMGHSMGGITAMGLAWRYGSKIAGAVSFNGSGDWELTHLFIEARFGVVLRRDWPLYDRIAAASPARHVEAMKDVPIFMTNGEVDTSVDPRAQAHFAEALARAGGMGRRVTYPGLGHFVTTNMMDDAIAFMEGGANRGIR